MNSEVANGVKTSVWEFRGRLSGFKNRAEGHIKTKYRVIMSCAVRGCVILVSVPPECVSLEICYSGLIIRPRETPGAV